MHRHTNLAEALMDRAMLCAADEALVYPAEGGGGQRISYAALDAHARAVSAWLRARDAPGRRVLLALDPGPHAAAALLGCLYAGAVAVPVPAPTASRTEAERTAAIAKDAAVDLVLTETAHATETSRRLSLVGRTGITCLAVDGLSPHAHPAPYAPAAPHNRTAPHTASDTRTAVPDTTPARTTPDSLALLAYDAGPATAPRGALITHGNLLAAMSALCQALGTGRRSRIGGWLPRHHTPGLIGQLLHPLWLGATAVPLPVRPHLADPVAWLRALSRHGITHTVAPDTCYARCAAEATDEQLAGLDLSRLRTALNAAEPVSAATMAAFHRRCAPAGLRPGALVAGYAPAQAAPFLTAEGRGPVPGLDLRVVDPATRRPQPDGMAGEIWVRGPAVAAGHWGRPRDTEAAGGFLRTGDLGIARDGEVRMTGRTHEGGLADSLMVGGMTLHPQDVERELLRCGRPLGSARVFCAGPGTGPLVVVQEVGTAGGSHAALAGLAGRVRECVAEEFGAATGGVLLVRPGTVRRGGSHKVPRATLREQFLRGEVRPLYQDFAPLPREPAAGGVV
ncbi:putative type I polyketide synthase component [Streptomyces bingchenggensis BCW-1]|uniref:Putative type I polyketide synthase component n=2 Tax=Streptomyces TaxID=1883 RepID=D7BZQ1_STRBB|nr:MULTISPECIES: AMP-binding protein [Streptomyces]ADI09956.1 putative type I polyketide synthase component [Streptomyces bingchenggensis BCW-1]